MKTAQIRSYKDLIVWQKSMDLVEEIYLLSSKYPKEEMDGLTSQMRRSAVSIPSNIAEGRQRRTKKDCIRFLNIAFSSGAELETQIKIAKRLPKMSELDYSKVGSLLEEVMKMLNSLIRKMQESGTKRG